MTAVIRTLDEFEAAYSEGIGRPMPLAPWRTITQEYLHRFSDGVGDHNPLYRDPSYANGGRFHSLVASPAFVMVNGGGMVAAIWGHIPQHDVSTQDLTMLYAGAEVEWYAPVFVGDRIRCIERPLSTKRISTRQLPDALITTALAEYWNSRSELVARVWCNMIRLPNLGPVAEPEAATGASEEVRIAPDPLVYQRQRRGNVPLFWDDVEPGDEIPELPKGTYTTTELYLFSYGAGGTNRVPQMEEGTIDMGAGGRADPEYARKHRAQSTTFDFGFQRICWLMQAATDWMGDHGDLIRLTSRIRRPNLLMDTNVIRGKVAKRYEQDGQRLVDVDLENFNQHGVATATATATVRLPVAGSIPDHSLLFSAEQPLPRGVYG